MKYQELVMHYCSDYKLEYWVKDKDDALLQRFEGDALYHARQTALNASGRVYEVQLDVTMEGIFVVSEMEI
jgi:hypothetical protein